MEKQRSQLILFHCHIIMSKTGNKLYDISLFLNYWYCSEDSIDMMHWLCSHQAVDTLHRPHITGHTNYVGTGQTVGYFYRSTRHSGTSTRPLMFNTRDAGTHCRPRGTEQHTNDTLSHDKLPGCYARSFDTHFGASFKTSSLLFV